MWKTISIQAGRRRVRVCIKINSKAQISQKRHVKITYRSFGAWRSAIDLPHAQIFSIPLLLLCWLELCWLRACLRVCVGDASSGWAGVRCRQHRHCCHWPHFQMATQITKLAYVHTHTHKQLVFIEYFSWSKCVFVCIYKLLLLKFYSLFCSLVLLVFSSLPFFIL